MSSAMTIPLSTSKPRERMMAAIDTVCSSTPSKLIAIKVARIVNGTMAPTTMPVRHPRNSTTTAMTAMIVSNNTWCMRSMAS
ncbi:hypothetical protein D3C77_691650 [compost metagenome]